MLTIGAPSPPAAVTAIPGNGAATVTWTAPASTNGSPTTGYAVTPSIGGVAQPAQTFNSTSLTQTITGLVNRSSVTFTIQAINVNGTGAPSAPSPPIVVGAPVASAPPTLRPLDNGIAVDWLPPTTNNGTAIVGYGLDFYLNGTTLVASEGVDFGEVQFTNLTNGLSYGVTVAARNDSGVGPFSAMSQLVVAGSPTAPVAPTVVPASGSANCHLARAFEQQRRRRDALLRHAVPRGCGAGRTRVQHHRDQSRVDGSHQWRPLHVRRRRRELPRARTPIAAERRHDHRRAQRSDRPGRRRRERARDSSAGPRLQTTEPRLPNTSSLRTRQGSPRLHRPSCQPRPRRPSPG